MSRKVTEADFRFPEFRDAKVEEYEWRSDDDEKPMRKDRWERGIRSIVSILGLVRAEWEIPDIVNKVRQLADCDDWTYFDPDYPDTMPPISRRVMFKSATDNSILDNCLFDQDLILGSPVEWNGYYFPLYDMKAWKEMPVVLRAD
jgi:hypothetical protein